ncbi:uncharacterized protein METZ01_LOCUS197328, partial [marine metagenome]
KQKTRRGALVSYEVTTKVSPLFILRGDYSNSQHY